MAKSHNNATQCEIRRKTLQMYQYETQDFGPQILIGFGGDNFRANMRIIKIFN